jgi:hypothetical protein
MDIKEAFYQFLVQHGRAFIEGVGCFTTSNSAVRTDVTNHLLHPASTTWLFSATEGGAAEKDAFIQYLQAQNGLSATEARSQYHEFTKTIQEQLQNGQAVNLEPVGDLSLDAGGQPFLTARRTTSFLQPVTAHRIIRKNEVHSMVVGENERTNIEMAEMLNEDAAPAKNRWWIAALVIAAAAITLMVWHFSGSASLGSRQPLHIQEQSAGK